MHYQEKARADELLPVCFSCPRYVVLRPDLDAAGFDWYLGEVVSTNELASTRLDNVIEEDFANSVVAVAWFTVVKNGKEGCVKLVVKNGITCLLN